MGIQIRPVATAQEVLAIQQQRYSIYVEELGYHQRYANSSTRTVAEPLDELGILFGAFDGEKMVASVRVNYGRQGAAGGFGEYTEMYGLLRFKRWFPYGISVVTKLMIDPAYRAGTLMARMGMALYAYTHKHEPRTRFCVIDCVPALRGFFQRLGYRQIGPSIKHPAAGLVVPMAFAVYHLRHFQSVRSPLAAVCPLHDEETANWFDAAFASCDALAERNEA